MQVATEPKLFDEQIRRDFSPQVFTSRTMATRFKGKSDFMSNERQTLQQMKA